MNNHETPQSGWPQYIDPKNGSELVLRSSDGQDYLEAAAGGE